MDIAKVGRIISQRFSISSLITFGLFLVLTVTVLYFDARTRRRIEEIASAKRFMSKKSLNVKPDDTAETGVGSPSTQWGEQPVLLLQALCMKNRFLSKKSLGDNPVHTPKPGPGSLYTRWGRTTCPRHSSLVYDGVVGGQRYDQTGGGSNLLCLPNDPIWANYTEEFEKAGYIYGTEYETNTHASKNLFSFPDAESIDDHNVPCAVCLTRQPAVVMMLPARTQCYPGWTAEYSGYLMSERYNYKGRHEYVCVDHTPEADPAGNRNEEGALLYFVQAACGSLPCPPYVGGREISCVVCSKY